MAIKLASSLLALNIPSNKILKTDANGNIVAAVDGTDYNTAAGQWISTTGGIFYADNVRIGTFQSDVTPEARLHVYQFGATTPKVLIEDGYNGDASVEFKISTQSYMMGIDNSDSDKFVLTASTALGTTNVLEVSTSGNPAFQTDTLFNKQVYFQDNIFFDANGHSLRFDHDGTRDLYQVTNNGTVKMYLRAVGTDNLQWEDANQDPILKLTQERDAYFYGKVGIGTDSPSSTLTVNGRIEVLKDDIGNTSEGGHLTLRSGSGYSYRFSIDNYQDNFRVVREDDGTSSNGNVPFLINTSGNVGIGTTSPAYKLDVTGDIRINSGNAFTDLNIKSDRTSGNIGGVNFVNASDEIKGQVYGHTDGSVKIASGGTSVAMTIYANGNLQFHNYGAGLLKTDANGNVSLDTNTYLTSLPSHTHDTRYYTKTQSDSKYLTKGDSFIPISMTASDYEASAEEVVIVSAGSYKGLAFPNGAKDFEFEVSIKGTNGANHQGIFWGATDLTSLLGAGLTGYKTTHQNADSLHIRDIANNSTQMTINPRFAPDDGQYHRYRLVQYRNPDTSNAILKVYLDGNLIFDTTHGGFNNPPQQPTYFGFIVYTGDVKFAHWNVREITDSEDLIRTIGENVFQPLGNYLTSLPAHHHDARYYTETEMDEFFDGTTAKTGYNKTNWDTAYGWGNHASAGYLTSHTETDTLATVVARGQETAQALVVTAVDSGNPAAAANSARLSGYGLLGNRGTFYLTNGGGVVQIGRGATHAADPVADFGTTIYHHKNTVFNGQIDVEPTNGISSSGWIHLHRYGTNTNVSVANNGSNVSLLVPNGNIETQGSVKLKNVLLFDQDGDFTGGNYYTMEDHSDGYFRMGYAFNSNLVISTSGNIGIGTTSPGYKLQVNHNTTSEYVSSFQNTADNLQIKIGTTTGALLNIQGATINTNTAYNIALQAEGGSVGIGTTSPAGKLTIKSPGDVDTDGDAFVLERAGTTAKLIRMYEDAADGFLEVRTGANDIVTKLSGYSGTPSYFLSRLGIGTTNPTKKLHVDSDGNEVAFFKGNSGGAWIDIQSSTSNLWSIGAVDANKMGIYNRTNATYPLVVENGGEVGIGTTTPYAQLHLNNGGTYVNTDANNRLFISRSSHAYVLFSSPDGFDQGFHFHNTTDNAFVGRIAYKHRSTGDSIALRVGGSSVNNEYLIVNSNGTVQVKGYGAGILKTDANGNVSLDTSTYATATDLQALETYANATFLQSVPSTFSATAITLSGIKLEESSDRPGILEINRDGSNSYAGIMTKYSDTAEWALMGDEGAFGLYDDQNNDWAWRYTENSNLVLYSDGVVRAATKSDGFQVKNVLEIGAYATTDQGILKLSGSTANKESILKTTNGNLHIDSADGHSLYLNYYTGTTDNIIFGNGNGGNSGAKITSGGVVHATGGNSGNWNTAYGWGNHASAGYATLSGANSFSNSYNEFGNGVGSVSNDGNWNARLNVAGTQHARLDVVSVSDGIITTTYSHTGNGMGKMGTISNHPLGLMTAGGHKVILDTGGNMFPVNDRTQLLGLDTNRWQVVFCEILDSAGLHEKNLQNPEGEKQIGEYETGTVLVWKGGKNVPCTTPADHMRMGIAVKGVSSPLVQGAEPVLCTGEVNEGDYLVTSSVEGHAAAISPQYMRQHNLFDCVLGKALEGGNGDSHIIKTWVNI